MTADEVLKNLKAMIGKEIDFDDVVCAFEDFEECGGNKRICGREQQ